jgi:fermentation-respiration switch protein FrsA (DUF1100 family)
MPGTIERPAVREARRASVWRILAAVVAILLVAYAGVLAYLVLNEREIVFRPVATLDARRPQAPFEQVSLTRTDGTREPVWIMRRADAAEAPWLIFLHGNDATIGARLNILHYERLRALGLNVLAPEYRGFAGTGGIPSERGVDDDARTAYDYARSTLGVPAERIIIFGWSLGSAVAVDLASRVPEAAVVLEGAPASLVDIGSMRYPYVPVRLLMRNPFESIVRVGHITAPMLFLHSPADAVVPIDEGRRLFAAVRSPKQFVEVAGGHVYAAERDPTFFSHVGAFLHAHGVLR